MAKSMGAEYNTPTGLDWGRIRREFEEASSPQDLVHEEAAAKAIKKGLPLAAAKAAGQEAVAKAFPHLAAPAKPALAVVPDLEDEDEDDEGAA